MARRRTHPQATKLPRQRRWKQVVTVGVAGVLLLVGGYLLLLTLAPKMNLASAYDTWNRPVEPLAVGENRLYIPSITLNIDYASGGPEVLNDKSWWRYPERGNPVEGGNFILSAHRFELGFTPGETIRKSPFYHFDRISEGDNLYVDYDGVRYQYQVERMFDVEPTAVEIEDPTEEHQLTVYTCDIGGQDVGRDVLVARLVKEDVDPAEPLE